MSGEEICVTIGSERFRARLLTKRAPQTSARFLSLLPWRQEVVHVRWSGEGCWIPLADFNLGVGPENVISDPRPGEFLFYPGGISETELLLAYGEVRFASRAGPLAGNPFLAITEKLDRLAAIGRLVLRKGALPIVFTRVNEDGLRERDFETARVRP